MRNRQGDNAHPATLQRHDPAARAIVLAWRLLTSPSNNRRAGTGGQTLVACSGGADSTALAFALARTRKITLAHVVHDLRPRDQAEADRDAVRLLAERLSLPLLEDEVRVHASAPDSDALTPRTTNLEARARLLRYRALAQMAHLANARFVATAHHADDQLESMLMALMRGTSLRGLRGVHLKRVLHRTRADDDAAQLSRTPIWLIRPMLHPACTLDKAAAEALCRRAGLAWREDTSNTDQSRLRAYLRANILPLLNDLRPGTSQRAAQAAVQLQRAAHTIDRDVHAWIGKASRVQDPRGRVTELGFDRDALRFAGPYLIGEVIRRAFAILTDSRGLDQLASRTLLAIVRAVQDRSTDPRSLPLGRKRPNAPGCTILIHAGQVRLLAPSPSARD